MPNDLAYTASDLEEPQQQPMLVSQTDRIRDTEDGTLRMVSIAIYKVS